MKKLLIILLGPLILGPAGYFLGKMLAPPPAPVEEMAEKKEEEKAGKAHATPELILYKMPLGNFTVQVMQPKNVLHIVVNMDVYIAGANEFERLNGAHGRASLRDSVIAILSDMAETSLWVPEGAEKDMDHREIVEEVVRKLHLKYNSIYTAKINEFNTTRTARI